MNKLSLYIWSLLVLLSMHLPAWAQVYDGDEALVDRVKTDTIDDFEVEEMVDYHAIHISLSDIIIVLLVVVSSYVFGKIWRGCTYLIIVLGVVFYMLLH